MMLFDLTGTTSWQIILVNTAGYNLGWETDQEVILSMGSKATLEFNVNEALF